MIHDPSSLIRPAVSVVLCTYNRADCVGSALAALLAQTGSIDYEVIVVDNNSSDGTAAVVRNAADRAGGHIRYVFERQQGLSHARNRGIREARAPIIAFTDDDVCVSHDWIRQIVRTFDAYPDIDYAGGRVLPRWLRPPPQWLTTAHWSPLALQDYGTDLFRTSRDRAICLVGANLICRRAVFDRVGVFAPALGRIRDGIGSTEDHDMQLRMWRAERCGLYVPDIVCIADVTPDRMVKSYHRRWHRGHGRHCAAMRLRELVPADRGPLSEPADIVLLFGSPGYVYADLVYFATRWFRAVLRREDSFFYANKVRHIRSYLKTRRRLRATRGVRAFALELIQFAAAYRRKRRARRFA